MKNLALLLLFFLMLVINGFAQVELKKLVQEDLFLTNEVYGYKLFDSTSIILTISESDSVRKKYSYAQQKKRVEENVNIINVDTSGNFLLFDVSFNNIKFNCYPTINNKNLNFRYLVYQSNNRYYKINGFLYSDVLLLDTDDFFTMNYFENYLNTKELERYQKNSNIKKLSKLLWSNILKVYNNEVDSRINFQPIFSSPRLYDCEAVD